MRTAADGLDPVAALLVRKLTRPFDPARANAAEMRLAYNTARAPLAGPLQDIGTVEKLPAVPGLPPRTLFRPIAQARRGTPSTFVFLHGGGWTVGDLSTYEPLCRRLANVLNANILWVDYRLAPEHPFPAAFEDTLACSQWLFSAAESLQLDANRIGIMGDSAGGNLAAAAALLNSDGRLGKKFLAQVLIYPCLDLTCSSSSHQHYADGYLLTHEIYSWYVGNYIGRAQAADWPLSPLHATDLSGVAPAVVLHAGFDILRDEAIEYCARLRDAKVPVKELAFSDMIHGFINMAGVLVQADDAVLCIRSSLHTLLSRRLSMQ